MMEPVTLKCVAVVLTVTVVIMGRSYGDKQGGGGGYSYNAGHHKSGYGYKHTYSSHGGAYGGHHGGYGGHGYGGHGHGHGRGYGGYHTAGFRTG